jgi:3-hydroxyacyl-CoA dehydrogenase
MTRPLRRQVPLRAKGLEAIAGRELGAFVACHAIVAAIVEDLDAKRQLFAEREALEKNVIIAFGRG